jgi:hypothetical protein
LIASVAEKKEGIMDLICDKKFKLNSNDRTNTFSNYKVSEAQTLLGKNNTGPQTKREINLLCSRLDKLFPDSTKNTNSKY